MYWKYGITNHTLYLMHDDGTEEAVSSSGWAGQPPLMNSPDGIATHAVGPLPPGKYSITAPYVNPKTGPYTMNLIPDPSNVMYGRADFRIHGASASHPDYSSEGCIIQLRTIRERIWESGVRQLVVTL